MYVVVTRQMAQRTPLRSRGEVSSPPRRSCVRDRVPEKRSTIPRAFRTPQAALLKDLGRVTHTPPTHAIRAPTPGKWALHQQQAWKQTTHLGPASARSVWLLMVPPAFCVFQLVPLSPSTVATSPCPGALARSPSVSEGPGRRTEGDKDKGGEKDAVRL